jgi:hypothetical protein
VVYASSSSALATGSGLTFNGTNLTLGSGYFEITGSNSLYLSSGMLSSSSGALPLILGFNGTEKMRIGTSTIYTASGVDVGIGTTSPAYKLDVVGNGQFSGTSADTRLLLTATGVANTVIGFNNSGSTNFAGAPTGTAYLSCAQAYPLVFGTSATERARIDSSGNLLVGTTSASLSTNTFLKAAGASNPVLYLFKNSTANTDEAFCIANGTGGGTVSFQVLANGNAQNTNNSYGAISDVKLKENIVDATPKLADLMQIKVRHYNFKSDETKTKQIGVVAQELEQVFPSMIEQTVDCDLQGNDLGTKTKAVKYSVFVPMLIKAIQEQQALIQSLKARLDAANL